MRKWTAREYNLLTEPEKEAILSYFTSEQMSYRRACSNAGISKTRVEFHRQHDEPFNKAIVEQIRVNKIYTAKRCWLKREANRGRILSPEEQCLVLSFLEDGHSLKDSLRKSKVSKQLHRNTMIHLPIYEEKVASALRSERSTFINNLELKLLELLTGDWEETTFEYKALANRFGRAVLDATGKPHLYLNRIERKSKKPEQAKAILELLIRLLPDYNNINNKPEQSHVNVEHMQPNEIKAVLIEKLINLQMPIVTENHSDVINNDINKDDVMLTVDDHEIDNKGGGDFEIDKPPV